MLKALALGPRVQNEQEILPNPHLNFRVKVLHDLPPAAQVTDVERMKINVLDRQRQLTHSAQNAINLVGVTSDILQIWT